MPRETDSSNRWAPASTASAYTLPRAARADDWQALDQLCRYITGPALTNERVQTTAAQQAVLKRQTPRRDGTTQLVMSPLKFMQRLFDGLRLHRQGLLRGCQFHTLDARSGSLAAGEQSRVTVS